MQLKQKESQWSQRVETQEQVFLVNRKQKEEPQANQLGKRQNKGKGELEQTAAKKKTNQSKNADEQDQNDAVKDQQANNLAQGNTKHKAWSREEDEKVKELIQVHGTKQWVYVASLLVREFPESNRNGKQCRERWNNYLDPTLNKSPWNELEGKMFLQAHKVFGNRWAEISKIIPGRTDNQVKNHFYSSIRCLIQNIKNGSIYKECQSNTQAIKNSCYLIKYLIRTIKRSSQPEEIEENQPYAFNSSLVGDPENQEPVKSSKNDKFEQPKKRDQKMAQKTAQEIENQAQQSSVDRYLLQRLQLSQMDINKLQKSYLRLAKMYQEINSQKTDKPFNDNDAISDQEQFQQDPMSQKNFNSQPNIKWPDSLQKQEQNQNQGNQPIKNQFSSLNSRQMLKNMATGNDIDVQAVSKQNLQVNKSFQVVTNNSKKQNSMVTQQQSESAVQLDQKQRQTSPRLQKFSSHKVILRKKIDQSEIKIQRLTSPQLKASKFFNKTEVGNELTQQEQKNNQVEQIEDNQSVMSINTNHQQFDDILRYLHSSFYELLDSYMSKLDQNNIAKDQPSAMGVFKKIREGGDLQQQKSEVDVSKTQQCNGTSQNESRSIMYGGDKATATGTIAATQLTATKEMGNEYQAQKQKMSVAQNIQVFRPKENCNNEAKPNNALNNTQQKATGEQSAMIKEKSFQPTEEQFLKSQMGQSAISNIKNKQFILQQKDIETEVTTLIQIMDHLQDMMRNLQSDQERFNNLEFQNEHKAQYNTIVEFSQQISEQIGIINDYLDRAYMQMNINNIEYAKNPTNQAKNLLYDSNILLLKNQQRLVGQSLNNVQPIFTNKLGQSVSIGDFIVNKSYQAQVQAKNTKTDIDWEQFERISACDKGPQNSSDNYPSGNRRISNPTSDEQLKQGQKSSKTSSEQQKKLQDLKQGQAPGDQISSDFEPFNPWNFTSFLDKELENKHIDGPKCADSNSTQKSLPRISQIMPSQSFMRSLVAGTLTSYRNNFSLKARRHNGRTLQQPATLEQVYCCGRAGVKVLRQKNLKKTDNKQITSKEVQPQQQLIFQKKNC